MRVVGRRLAPILPLQNDGEIRTGKYMHLPEVASSGSRMTNEAISREALTVAVVIPTKNRPSDLDAALGSILAQSVLPNQIILIDQSTGCDSERLARSRMAKASEHVRESVELCYVHDISLSGASAARNRAFEEFRSRIVLFLDDDVVLEGDFIEELVRAYEMYPQASGISGIITNYAPPARSARYRAAIFERGPFHDDRQPVYWKAELLKDSEPIRVTRFGGGLMSFKSNVIAGYRFDERLTGACPGEDVEFCLQLGRQAVLLIAPKVRLAHKRTLVSRAKDDWMHTQVMTNWYLFFGHWNSGWKNRLAFAWNAIGYFPVLVYGSIRRLSMSPWHAFISGAKDGFRISHEERQLMSNKKQKMS